MSRSWSPASGSSGDSKNRRRSPLLEALVRRHSLFFGVPEPEIAPVFAGMVEMRFEPGQIIYAEGDPVDGLYVLAAGVVRFAATDARGQPINATLSGVELFGEMGVLDGELRSVTATASGMCVAYFVPADPFLDLLEQSAVVGARLVKRLAGRLRRDGGPFAELPIESV
jgi:CRP/FNR family transcriptional regulator, cyclic AMP receptor protein